MPKASNVLQLSSFCLWEAAGGSGILSSHPVLHSSTNGSPAWMDLWSGPFLILILVPLRLSPLKPVLCLSQNFQIGNSKETIQGAVVKFGWCWTAGHMKKQEQMSVDMQGKLILRTQKRSLGLCSSQIDTAGCEWKSDAPKASRCVVVAHSWEICPPLCWLPRQHR